ncbi:SAM dependent carboxyl methyltransferase [Macleaya cordata]|uniref:SAM dependent carboxyl methyltransferase n=1 Tax=Macleaya cordata TaxID=56857 RepID=A0A200QE41_MACCD|nr:SAM dependent carboxyl methyltransferase [Macleaya cordata]
MAKPIIEEAIMDIFSKYTTTIPMKSIIGFADLGCSSGPNTLLVVSYLMDTIFNKCRGSDVCASPEFLVFLNDLPSNDFNTIFKTLQGFCDEQKETKGDGFGPCFISGVPGTFYGRLFPRETLHFVHSSYSLHWLSQVPQGIDQSNKKNIYLAKSSPPFVLEAYLRQFQRDFWVFLRSRSKEIVGGGGRMVLTLIGRRSEDPCSKECCYFWELLAVALGDMVKQGLIEEEKLNSFNLPHYMPSPSEIKSVIQSEGSFIVNRLETFEVNWDGEDAEDTAIDKFRSSYNATNCIRAVSESLLVSHFGEEIIDELFRRYMQIVADRVSREESKYINIVISMTKE